LALDDLKKSDAGNLGTNLTGDGSPKPKGDKDPFESKVESIMTEKKVSKGTAIGMVAKEFPEIHNAWLEKERKRQGFDK
jgi:hypothetical protein